VKFNVLPVTTRKCREKKSFLIWTAVKHLQNLKNKHFGSIGPSKLARMDVWSKTYFR